MMSYGKLLLKKTNLYDPTRTVWLHVSRPEWWKQEQARRRFFKRLIHRGSLCFDVGANAGKYTADLLELGARVVAVEPQAICLAKLRKAYSHNPRVALVPAAVGPSEGEITMYTTDATAIGSCSKEWVTPVRSSGRFSGHDWNESVQVPMTTLDKLIEGQGVPAFCKIDVEGFELDVLHGLSTPIAIISFEFSPETIQRTRDCVAYLTQLGDYRFNYCSHGSCDYDLPDSLTGDAFRDLLGNLPPRAMKWGGDVYATLKH